MNALLNSIPRDADYNSELWTTVDKDRTNVRAKAVSKILQGFGFFLTLMAKNYLYENRTESRFRDLIIVCNVQASSGPTDVEGLYYRVNGASNRLGALAVQAASRDSFDESRDAPTRGGKEKRKTLEVFENDMDEGKHRKGIVRSNSDSKTRHKVPCIPCILLFCPHFPASMHGVVAGMHEQTLKHSGLCRVLAPPIRTRSFGLRCTTSRTRWLEPSSR